MPAEILVSHGRSAGLSRCRAPLGLSRGEAVVVRTARGPELGCVLGEAPGHLAELTARLSEVELLRPAAADDLARSADLEERGRRLLDDAQRLVDELRLPLLPLDADLTLDGSHAVVQVLRWGSCTLTPFLEELRRLHGLTVALLDRSRPEEPEHGHDHGCGSCGSGEGCGDGGCSGGGCSTGGGCKTGGCSSGTRSAGELTAQFAQLRQEMEARAHARVPLA